MLCVYVNSDLKLVLWEIFRPAAAVLVDDGLVPPAEAGHSHQQQPQPGRGQDRSRVAPEQVESTITVCVHSKDVLLQSKTRHGRLEPIKT